MRDRRELLAYATFLLSEKNRHQADITMIDKKLSILASKGIVAEKEGDWIKEEELLAWSDKPLCRSCGHPECDAAAKGYRKECEYWRPAT